MADENVVQADPTTNPFLWAQKDPSPFYTPGQRVVRALGKGLTLGAAASDFEPQGFVENAAEFVGGIAPVTALSVAATPAVGAAARLARLAPLSTTATAIASNAAVDTSLAAIDSFTRDRPFIEGAATNMAMSAVGAGLLHGLPKLRGLSKEADNLDNVAKATTTIAPDTPPIKPPETAPLTAPTPPSAPFGPNISRDVTGPSNRVPLHHYVELQDEYGKPLNLAPETRLSFPTEQFDEYGNPRQVFESVSPNRFAVETAQTIPEHQVEKKLTAQFDPRLNTHVMTPKTEEVDKVVQQLHDAPTPRQTEIQFDPAQQKYLNSPAAEPLNNKLADVAKKQEEQSTSKLLTKSEEEVQKIVDTQEPAKVIDVVEMKKSKDYKRVEEIVKRTGISEPEVLQIVKQAEQETAKETFQSLKGKELATAIRIERIIQQRCK